MAVAGRDHCWSGRSEFILLSALLLNQEYAISMYICFGGSNILFLCPQYNAYLYNENLYGVFCVKTSYLVFCFTYGIERAKDLEINFFNSTAKNVLCLQTY